MRDVAVVSFAQVPNVRRDVASDEVELVQAVCSRALAESGLKKDQIGFTCSGSSDFLVGRPFSFVMALDGVGAWPPISESHVEMDGAFALYEAWIRLQHGDIEAALVYCFGRASQGDIREVLVTQLDPYYVAPLWPDSVSVAALQARALLDTGRYTERDMAEVASRSRRSAKTNPNAQVSGDFSVEDILADEYIVAPLRKHDCPPMSDGASAVILVADDLAREVCDNPAWIRGMDTRIEAHSLGARNLAESVSTRLAGENVGVTAGGFDVAELHAPFTHQELILRDALGLHDASNVNPSGGALAANPMMVAGLTRIGEAARPILAGEAQRTLAHATSGPALQQNLVCVMEAG